MAVAGVLVLAMTCSVMGASGLRPVEGLEGSEKTVPDSAVAAAKSPRDYLTRFSKEEPDACITRDGRTVTTFTDEVDSGTTQGNGLSVSPSTYDLENLLPGTDYRLCILVRSFSEEPVQMQLDDVDLRADSDDNTQVELVDQASGAGTWAIPTIRKFVAKKGRVYKIPYIIRTPERLPGGTVVGGIRAVRQAIGSGEAGIQAGVTQRIYVSSPGGVRKRLTVDDLRSNRIITGKPGKAALNVYYTLRNESDYLVSFTPGLIVKGLGRKVAEDKVPGSSLLPGGGQKVEVHYRKLPWIGIFHPTVRVETSDGPVIRKLPMVIVLPPLIYTLSVLAALLLPILYFLFRWWRNRQDWRQYLEDFDDEEELEADPNEAYWDPAAPR